MTSTSPSEAVPAKKTSRKPRLSPFCSNIIGKSPSICKVFSLIEKVQDTDSTVLIQGESGTGKELIAQALHYGGERRDKPFVPVNCGAIPTELLESELFGHEKGAFTHAIRTRIGRFEMADQGTVFLDEIAEMSPVLQVKLLRVLQEKKFERVGGAKTISSDFRVIAATNRDLAEEVRNGNFREDLYYRLTVIPIESPPLRVRKSDIPLLVEKFLERFCASKKRFIRHIEDDAMECLKRYQWPGNVRELENLIERMVILAAGDVITMEDLPPQLLNAPVSVASPVIEEIPETDFCLSDVVADYEMKLIIRALQQTGWVKNRAAQLLKVNRTTLLEKMKRHGVIKPAER